MTTPTPTEPEHNAGIEFHDSDLLEIDHQGTDIILHVRACLYTSAGIPGTDAGLVWRQAADIILWNATLLSPPFTHFEIGLNIYDGVIDTNARKFTNIVFLPFDSLSAASIELAMRWGEYIRASADWITIEMKGDREFPYEFSNE